MIRFHNTLSGRVEDFRPITPGQVKLYTCGPTVYDYSHIGNYRAYIFEDILKRFLQMSGLRVTHIMNITDVDDKTIRGAKARGISLREHTEVFVQSFFEDIRALNIIPADNYPRATDHIPEMVRLVQGLLDKGFAYEKDGSIYFSIAKFPAYGRLSKIDLAGLIPGQRIEADEYEKENVHDFALWKKAKEGEPSWDVELGPGRPGWHIECSAMSLKYLGRTFDLHCGGVDNIFPHHENEIAQSESFTGTTFVHYWLHCHHLIVDGQKMSKSKGNFFTLKDLLAQGLDPLDLRFLLLATHYRKTLNYTSETLAQARAARQRLRDFLYELDHRSFSEGETKGVRALADDTRARFLEGLGDDLNVSTAMTVLFEFIRKVNIRIAGDTLRHNDAVGARALLVELDSVLGVLPRAAEGGLPAHWLQKIKEREKARLEKNYALADKLRAELLEAGILLEDSKEGVRWKVQGRAPRA
jgi:cysteinyl-tRNA synthetase